MRGRALLLGVLVGCGGVSPPVDEVPRFPCEGAGFDGDVSFDPAEMLCVQVSMDPDEFVTMADQQRWGENETQLWEGVISEVLLSCTSPFPDPYTWFSSDVVVDGEALQQVGIRKKGFVGSVLDGADRRPSIKLKTDRFVEDQELGGTERVTLNNNLTDRSRMRTCLTYSLFDDAGYPAPQCNLANVSVNGRSLGAYTHVEALKKRFLRRAFGNDEGSLYEATVADFTHDHLPAGGIGRWEAKTGDSDETGAPLRGVASALEAPDDALEDALAEVLDLDAFFVFWAMETLVAHHDGHAGNRNNTYVYFDPDRGGRGVLIPWGPDDAMSRGGDVQGFVGSELSRRISTHPTLYDRYLDTLQDVLDTVYDEATLQDRVDVFEAQIETAEDPCTGCIEDVRDWIDGRRAAVQAFIDAGGEMGDEEPLECFPPGIEVAGLGEVASTLAHSCGSVPAGPSALLGLFSLAWMRRRR